MLNEGGMYLQFIIYSYLNELYHITVISIIIKMCIGPSVYCSLGEYGNLNIAYIRNSNLVLLCYLSQYANI